MQRHKGLIVITGVDGCGKSSVIEALRVRPAENPKLLFCANSVHGKNKSQVGDKISNYSFPRRSVMLSLFKLFSRGLNWLWEYHARYAQLLDQDYDAILCDRFYLDELLIDPLKYRYDVPLWLTRGFRNVLPHPDVYILLDAPESVLFARKQEVSFEEVKRLRFKYLEWIQQQPCGYCIDASLPLEIVTGNVLEIIMANLHKD
jgi:thymidylate kinase